MDKIDHEGNIGKKFGGWTVLDVRHHPSRHRMKVKYLVRCDCGVERWVFHYMVRLGKSVHCFNGRKGYRRHGVTAHDTRPLEYHTWAGMRDRCNNPNSAVWGRYGGRGIRVCQRWDSYENFIADMGPRPGSGYTIERINNDGNYEPGNCRWATRAEQVRNFSANRYIVAFGQRKLLVDWSRELGINEVTIHSRLARGWSAERAVSEPPRSGCRP